MGYAMRLVDAELDALLPGLAAVALDGPKGVGKTATCRRRAKTMLDLSVPETVAITEADPANALRGRSPLLIDEWQRLPWLWDAVRRAVDDGADAGSFLLTGSATPPMGTAIHSGAGRIVSLRMRPMSLPEREVAEPTVSMAELLRPGSTRIHGTCPLNLGDYVREIEASGFPGIRGLPERARRVQLDSYLVRTLTRDLTDEQNVTVRRPATLRAWIRAYAAATSTTATWEAIRRGATPGDADPPSKTTSIRYRDWLTSLWLLDPVEAWQPSGASLRSLTRAPKHHLADPALAARLLHADAASLLNGAGRLLTPQAGTLLGALFESLATLTVRTIAQALEAETFHLRTEAGEREVDLIVEGPSGDVVGFEVKLKAVPDDRDAKNLLWLRDAHPGRVSDLVILTTGERAYRRPDGVAVVPLALLGA